jgi:hypothetical protein
MSSIHDIQNDADRDRQAQAFLEFCREEFSMFTYQISNDAARIGCSLSDNEMRDLIAICDEHFSQAMWLMRKRAGF